MGDKDLDIRKTSRALVNPQQTNAGAHVPSNQAPNQATPTTTATTPRTPGTPTTNSSKGKK